MSALRFCRECGNLYQKHYLYCPFCGNKKSPLGAEDEDMPVSSKKGAKAVREAYLARLTRLEKKLCLIDRELDAFIVPRR